MSSKGNLSEGAEIVDPVETGLVSRGIIPRNKEIDRIRAPGTQRVCKSTADPGSCSRGTQRIGVADLVQGDVALDKLCQLESVAWLSLSLQKAR